MKLFEKKGFYQIDYEKLKSEFLITFKELSNEDLFKIKKVIIDFKDAKTIEDLKAKLFFKDCTTYESIDDLITEIIQIIKTDYRDSYFKSKKFGWNFQYFLNSSDGLYKDTLFISNAMTYPNDENFGNVIYHLLAIKKGHKKYYLWNLLT